MPLAVVIGLRMEYGHRSGYWSNETVFHDRLGTVDSSQSQVEYMQATVAESWEVPQPANIRWFVHVLPSLTDFAFLLPSFLLFFILPGAKVLLSDCDTGWQIRTGDWILQHRAVPVTDLFSFTKAHEAWFAWEWGADVGLALVHRAGGLGGVALAAILLLGLISAVLFRLIRRVSSNDFLAFGFVLVAICGSIMHWLARPHLFTWLFALVFSHVVLTAERGNQKPLVWLPVAMLLWTNLHGGFFIGLLILLASAAGAALKTTLDSGRISREAFSSARPYLLCTLACCAVTFVNPYGWRLHEHVAHYLLDSKLLDNIQEYQAYNFRQPGAIFFECMLLFGVGALIWCLRRAYYSAALTILLWTHLALTSARNVPIFLLLTAPWMAAMCEEGLERARSIPWLKRRNTSVLGDIAREFQPLERIERWHLVSGVAVVFIALAFASGRPGFESRFNPKVFPVQAIPALQSAHVSRLFTSDQWADYLLYQFFPSVRVFMDDRSDFYGYDFVTKYQHIMNAQHDWQHELKQFAIDAVLVEPDAAIASVLKQSTNWKILADGGTFILFQKRVPTQERQRVTNEGSRVPQVSPEGVLTQAATVPHTTLVPLPNPNERRSL